MSADETPWGPAPVAADRPGSTSIGPLTLHTMARDGELYLAHHREGEAVPDEPAWTRWAGRALGAAPILLAPALPDRALVVSPEQPFSLLPGSRARIYLRVAVWVQVSLEEVPDTPLVELPTRTLSDTWWGGPEAGELAYWFDTRARRSLPGSLHPPHACVCPVELENQADVPLQVERLAVRTPHLALFIHEGRLWSGACHVRYEAHDGGSELEFSPDAPPEAQGAERIAGPRTSPPGGLRALTFVALRNLSGR